MTGYVRKDTTNNIADGNVINAADLDAEFDGVQAAFNASTGHKHDGTASEGATINALGPTQDVTISATLVAPKTTNFVDIGSSGLKFKDMFLAGNASIGGTLAVTGVATFTAQPILSSLTASRAVFSDGSKGLVSNAITGTGNVVMSASPTLTGTIGGASLTLSSLTSGRVTYAGASGLLQDSANLLYSGTDLTVYGITVGRGAGAVATNTAVGSSALVNNSSGYENAAFGYLALTSNTTGYDNTAIGRAAMNTNIGGFSNTAIGALSSYYNTTGSSNVAVGMSALQTNTVSSSNTAVGFQAGYAATGSNATVVGYQAGYSQTGGNLEAFGYQAGYSVTSGLYNTAFGALSLKFTTTGASNSAFGRDSLQTNTTGTYNVAIGASALFSNTTASYSTAVGFQAAYYNTTGKVTAFGSGALNANTTGVSNSAVGGTDGVSVGAALAGNTTGSYNTAMGGGALNSNTTASNNTAVGFQAGYYNTTGSSHVFVGYQAGKSNTTGNVLVAVGERALLSNTTGDYNTAIGATALLSNTTGTNNSSLGLSSLYSNTTGSNNIAVGHQTLYSNTTGNNNTAVGYQAVYSNTTASGITAVGYQAGYSNTTGIEQTLIGAAAGRSLTTGKSNTFIGVGAGYSATTGDGNVFIGAGVAGSLYSSGYYVTTGSKNSILGNYNGNQGGLDIRTASNYIVLSDGDGNPRGIFDSSGNLLVGTTSAGGGSNVKGVTLNTAGQIAVERDGGIAGVFNRFTSDGAIIIFRRSATQVGSIDVTTTATSYVTSSDYRLKNSIAPMQNALAKVAALKPVTYKWNANDSDGEGFIAHELAEVCPHAVSGEKDAVDDEGNPQYQGIDTSFLVATLTAAIQEQQAIIESLKARLDAANL